MNPDSTQLRDQQLSAEAKSFVPKNHLFGSTLKPAALAGRHHTVHIPCSRPPNYATMCHPIISPDSLHSRPRLSATWEGPGRPQYLQNSELSNGLKSCCLSERGILLPQSMAWDDLSEYNRVQSYAQHQYLSQAVPDTQVFSTSHTLPPGFALLDVQYPMSSAYPAVQYSPENPLATSGYPGVALPPFVENGTTSTHKWSTKGICAHSKRKAVFNSNQVTVGVQYEMNGQDAEMQQKPVSKSRTIICRDYETQTDFSTEIADKNLQTLPSPLYDETLKNRTSCENSTETDALDAEDPYSAVPMTHWMPNNNASLYPKPNPCPSFGPPHSNADPVQYLMDAGPSAYLCLADSSGVLSEDFRYCVLHGDLPSTSVDAGHRVLSTSPYGYVEPVPGGFYWRPRSLVETDPTQLRNQKRGRHKARRGNNVGTNGSGTADSGLRISSSVGTDALTRGVHEVEDEFPRLLIAADGLSLLGFENGNLTEAFVRNRLAGDQYENFQQHQWTGSTFPYGTRQISSSNRERLGKGSKKKQKRQEQLSRAADEELAQISLEQQVLSEMGNNRRRLVIPFRLDHTSSSQSDGSISGGNTEPVKNSENSDITLESAELSHDEDCSKPIDTKYETGHVEMVICKKQGDNEKNCDNDRITELSTAVNGLTVDIQRNNIVLFGVDLSLSASSKNSSMDNNSSRASPVSTEMSPISQTSPFNTSSLTASPAGSGVTSPRLDLQDLKKSSIVTSIHSPRFREYCNQVLSREIDECCTQLLAHLVRFQDKFYQFESSSSLNMMKRRTVLGLREVTKHLRQSKLCCVIISPNMEQIQSKGLDESLRNIIRLCEQQRVLVVYALGRHALGRALAKLVPVSVVGIFSCEGAEEHFHRLQRLTREARSAYQDLVTSLLQASASISLENGCSSRDIGHSRTPSGCSIMSLTSSSLLSEPISENELETEEKEINRSAPPPYLGQNSATNTGSRRGESDIVANGLCDGSAADSEVFEGEDDDDKVIVCEKLESYESDSECPSSQNRAVRRELDSKQSRDPACTGHVTSPENGRPENSESDASLVNACAGTAALKPKAIRNNRFESCTTVVHSTTASASDQLSANVVGRLPNPTSACDDIG